MAKSSMLNNFTEIKIESPIEKIIRQIRGLITSGQLNPGDKLPSERKLAEKLGVGRSHVREAIQKLEFYGILKTMPQNGTMVAGIGITALEGLISDVLKLEDTDFAALVETRVVLEQNSARLAAMRRTESDLKNIEAALNAYEAKIEEGGQAVEEDLMFHLAIAEASQNSVLKSLMLVITPDIIHSFNKLEICKSTSIYKALEEHRLILKHIADQQPEEAASAMLAHLQDVSDYSESL
ncbi:MAG: FadR/GntR family transcriptional regulator, partial [Bacteroidota bacterium]